MELNFSIEGVEFNLLSSDVLGGRNNLSEAVSDVTAKYISAYDCDNPSFNFLVRTDTDSSLFPLVSVMDLTKPDVSVHFHIIDGVIIGEDLAIVHFNEHLCDFFNSLWGYSQKYDLLAALKFSSKYTVLLYEFLQDNDFFNFTTFAASACKIREAILCKGIYTNASDLDKILKRAACEISLYSSVNVAFYSENVKNRRVYYLTCTK